MTDDVNSLAQNPERARSIACLNDRLRRTGQGGIILATRGVRSLPCFDVSTLLAMLREYGEFDEDNDPYGERDFGDLEIDGHDLLWKIDYYDNDMLNGSPDPADVSVTHRVLAVMLASEY